MIKGYLQYRFFVFAFYGCVLFFFPLISFLSNLPREPMWYSLFIFSFLFLVWMIVDLVLFRSKVKKLREIRENISFYSQNLPKSAHLIEQEYQDILAELYQMFRESTGKLESLYAEQEEYYTLWIHQIKTPLSAMHLVLQKENIPVPLLEQELFKVEQYAEMALQYVKIKNLTSDLVIQPYSLSEIIHQSVKKYAPLFIYKKLRVSIANVDFMVATDSKWLSFLLEQLLSNGIKYTQTGGIQLEGKKDRLCLIIEDTGMGIRPEDIERIFEKGYTGYNGRLDKKASGIGLYLAKKVANTLGISIHLTSKLGSGTKIMLFFPTIE